MAVKIRLKRMGAKKQPFYRIVVANSTDPRNGKYIEAIGTYDPKKEVDGIHINIERAQYWLSKGAQPTDTVSRFFKQRKIKPAPLGETSKPQENSEIKTAET